MLRKVILSTLTVLFIINFFSGCTKRSPVVASIGNRGVVRLNKFEKDFLKTKSLQNAKKSNIDERKQFLNKIIDNKLILISAKEAHMNRDSIVRAHVEQFKKGKLIQRLYDVAIVDKVIKEKEIRDLYARLSKEATVRMIFFKRPSDNSTEKLKEIKDKAKKTLERIKNGEDFAKVASEVSDDPSSRQRGGLIQTITWTKKDDPIRKTIFSMKEGDVSNILDDRQGLFIFKVEKFKTIKQEHYKNARDQMRRRLISMNRPKLSTFAKKYLDETKKEYFLSWQDSSIKQFAKTITPFAKLNNSVLVDSLEKLPNNIKRLVLIKCKDKTFTVTDFIFRLKITPARSKIAFYKPEGLKIAIDSWLTEDALVYNAMQKGLNKDPEVSASANLQLNHEMSIRFIETNIDSNITVSDKELKESYDANKDKKYFFPEKAKIQEIMVKDKDLAYKLAKRAKKGENFSKLAKKYTERSRYKKQNGVVGYIPKGSWGIIGDKAFSMKVGKISDPISLGKRYSIIKLLDIKDKKIKPFKDVIEKVRKDIINDKKNNLKQEWLIEKQNELRVKIYDSVLVQAFK